MNCTFCEKALENEAEQRLSACLVCAISVGMVPMPPLTRPPVPCGRCNTLKFMRVIPREHTADQASYQIGIGRAVMFPLSAPMFATHVPQRIDNNRGLQPLNARNGYGMLEMFICKGCGFVEWYCPAVNTIPAHPHLNTEEVDYEANKPAPYR